MPTLKQIIEKNDSGWGRIFDLFIMFLIFVSVIAFSIQTIPDLSEDTRHFLHLLEIFLVVLFSVEYLLRLWVADHKLKFIFSFYGIIDLLAILPFYLSTGIDLKELRAIRLLRLFRAFKLFRYLNAANRIFRALRIVREEIILFLAIAGLMLFFSAVGIYYFEHPAQPDKFGSIFDCLWWSVATLTTVGYGDIYPITGGGRLFTFVILMVGLGVVAVPTGMLASALSKAREEEQLQKPNVSHTTN
jgi:voltage-gated potassium channel